MLGIMVPCPPALPSAPLDGDSSHVCSPDVSDLNDLDDEIPASDGSDLAKQQRTLTRMKARPQPTSTTLSAWKPWHGEVVMRLSSACQTCRIRTELHSSGTGNGRRRSCCKHSRGSKS